MSVFGLGLSVSTTKTAAIAYKPWHRLPISQAPILVNGEGNGGLRKYKWLRLVLDNRVP